MRVCYTLCTECTFIRKKKKKHPLHPEGKIRKMYSLSYLTRLQLFIYHPVTKECAGIPALRIVHPEVGGCG